MDRAAIDRRHAALVAAINARYGRLASEARARAMTLWHQADPARARLVAIGVDGHPKDALTPGYMEAYAACGQESTCQQDVIAELAANANARYFLADHDWVSVEFAKRKGAIDLEYLLSDSRRRIRNSDACDIEILAMVLPYSDLVLTDAYMKAAVRTRRLDTAYGVEVLGAGPADLRRAAAYLDER